MASRASQNMPLDIIDAALSRLLAREATVEACLREYPEHAEELRALLSAAAVVRDRTTLPGPRSEFRTNARIRLMNRMQARVQSARPRAQALPRFRPQFAVRSAQAMVGLVLTLALVFSSIGVGYASASSLPGSQLYGLKRGIEQVRLALSLSDAGDAGLLAEFSSVRLEELQLLTLSGQKEMVGAAAAAYVDALEQWIASGGLEAAADPATSEMLASHLVVLEQVQAQAPDLAQAAIEHAIERSSHAALVHEQMSTGGSPSNVAPGQVRREESGTPAPAATPLPIAFDDEVELTPAPTELSPDTDLFSFDEFPGQGNGPPDENPGQGEGSGPPDEFPGQGQGPPITPPGHGGEPPGQAKKNKD